MCDMFAVIFTALLYRRGLVQLKQGKVYFCRVLQAHIPKNSIVNFRGKVFDRRIGAVHFSVLFVKRHSMGLNEIASYISM